MCYEYMEYVKAKKPQVSTQVKKVTIKKKEQKTKKDKHYVPNEISVPILAFSK